MFDLFAEDIATHLSQVNMQSLRDLALKAVPNPGTMAELYFPPSHPLFKELKVHDYEELCKTYQQEQKNSAQC